MSRWFNFKLLAIAVLSLVGFGALADAKNILIAFSTPGPDLYADGEVVADGEWYALVWTQGNKGFAGMDINGNPLDANDKVIFIASLAKGGRCPYTVFQIDSSRSSELAGGSYSVYLLDTRCGKELKPAAAGAKGRPKVVNALSVAQDKVVEAGVSDDLVKPVEVAAARNWKESAVLETNPDFKQPKIVAFNMLGKAKVEIVVDDLMPNLRYNVQMGPSPNKLDNYALTMPASGVESARFCIDSGDAKFFRVVRQPLSTKAAE